MAVNVGKEIAGLKQMTVRELREKYEAVFDEPTRAGKRDWLFKRIVWRVQAAAEGELTERARRRAKALAKDVDLRVLDCFFADFYSDIAFSSSRVWGCSVGRPSLGGRHASPALSLTSLDCSSSPCQPWHAWHSGRSRYVMTGVPRHAGVADAPCAGIDLIGSGDHLRVLHQQNVLTVGPQTRRRLGLIYQRYHRRRLRPPSLGNDRTEARHVPIEERGSYWWIEAIRSTGPPPDDGVELE